MRLTIVNFITSNPIAAGIIALLIGAGIGFTFEQSLAENHLMGGARQRLLERAKEAAGSIKQKAADAANEFAASV